MAKPTLNGSSSYNRPANARIASRLDRVPFARSDTLSNNMSVAKRTNNTESEPALVRTSVVCH
jgi:hypothetical protein